MNRLLDVQMLARRAQDQIDGALRLAVHLRQVKGQEAQRQVSGEQPKKKECPTLILAALNAHHQYFDCVLTLSGCKLFCIPPFRRMEPAERRKPWTGVLRCVLRK